MSYGARSLIFLSRSAGKSTADQEFFKDLQQCGCHVQCYNGDVLDSELIRTVVRESHKPIAGVFQMAMVLRDVGFGVAPYMGRIQKDLIVLAALFERWDLAINAFRLPTGPITITMEDIHCILRLPI